MTDKEIEELEKKKEDYSNKYKFNPEDNILKLSSKKPSISDYNQDLILQPMREKEILSRKDQKAKELVVGSANKFGINLDMGDNPSFNYGKYLNPPVPSKKEPSNISEASKNLNSSDPAISAKGFLDLKGEAPQQDLPKIDSKQLMDDARKQRKLKWTDALAAFLTGYSGRKYDSSNSGTAQLQKKRDSQFQEYKDITSNNQKVKEVWDSKNRTELIDFLQSQKDKGELTASEKARYDALQQELNYKNEALKQKTETDRLRITNSKNKTSNTRSAAERINLPFESENIINEMNYMTGGASEAKSKRNQQRLNDLLASQPEDKKGIIFSTLTDLSEKSSKVRTQLEKQETLRNKAKSNSLPTDEYDSKISELEAELNQYQGNIKSVLNGKIPENTPQQQKTTSPEATKQKLDDFFK